MASFPHQFATSGLRPTAAIGIILWFSVMEEVPLSTQAIARNKAAKLEAGADLLSGLAAFWRGIGISTRRTSAK
jgi:hypothetical protein